MSKLNICSENVTKHEFICYVSWRFYLIDLSGSGSLIDLILGKFQTKPYLV